MGGAAAWAAAASRCLLRRRRLCVSALLADAVEHTMQPHAMHDGTSHWWHAIFPGATAATHRWRRMVRKAVPLAHVGQVSLASAAVHLGTLQPCFSIADIRA